MSGTKVEQGTLLWVPSDERKQHSRLTDYTQWLRATRNVTCSDWHELHAFSVSDLPAFWQSIWDYFGVAAHAPASAVLRGTLPRVEWFPGAQLNYAEHALRFQGPETAVIFRSETGERVELTRDALIAQVARARAGLRRLGVGRGDRVAALAPNRPETLIAFLATASLGAIWSSCSPEFGVGSVLDRFRQIEPKVLFAVDEYVYGGRRFDRRAELERVRAALPSLEATVRIGEARDTMIGWDELTRDEEPLAFEPVPFDHPLWILYSSGTTGLPKAIVHGHGGILLEHLKALALHSDLGPGDRFFWFSTTGWMMWNFLVSGLLVGACLVLYDGSPAHPSLRALYRLIDEERITYFGTSAPFLLACQKAGIRPSAECGLGSLRTIGSTGAPLPAEGFAWVYENVKSDVLLASISGGTDMCTAFVLSCPWLPVHAGEIQCSGLGARVEAFDEHGNGVVGEVGELVITTPMPSMPTQFWNDPGDERRIESYFSVYPGVWRHGDWIRITERASCVIYGRSDSTLNRGGVRMGTSEFYRVVEALDEVTDSLVVDTGTLEAESGKLFLFVVLRPGVTLDAGLEKKLRDTLRRELSPRHVPDAIHVIGEVPRTLNGKKLEVPVKKILLGTPVERALSRDTLANPAALDPFVALVASSGGGASPS